MSILVKNIFIGLANATGKYVIFTALNTKRCVAAAITAISFVKKRMC